MRPRGRLARGVRNRRLAAPRHRVAVGPWHAHRGAPRAQSLGRRQQALACRGRKIPIEYRLVVVGERQPVARVIVARVLQRATRRENCDGGNGQPAKRPTHATSSIGCGSSLPAAAVFALETPRKHPPAARECCRNQPESARDRAFAQSTRSWCVFSRSSSADGGRRRTWNRCARRRMPPPHKGLSCQWHEGCRIVGSTPERVPGPSDERQGSRDRIVERSCEPLRQVGPILGDSHRVAALSPSLF